MGRVKKLSMTGNLLAFVPKNTWPNKVNKDPLAHHEYIASKNMFLRFVFNLVHPVYLWNLNPTFEPKMSPYITIIT